MTRRTPIVAALALLAAGALPAGAAPAAPAPSRYGTAKNFQVLGSTTLGNRGVNSPIAVAGRCVYVGDRYDANGIAIVDVANPRKPTVIGKIPPVAGATQRELRADAGLGLLVVMNYALTTGRAGANNLKIYDIRNCAKPALLSTYDMGARSAHEFFLWKDPKKPGRALVYLANTIFSPDLEVVDITDPTRPLPYAAYDIGVDHAQNPATGLTTSDGGYLHSLSVSDDGTRAYLSTWDFGVYVADTSALAQGLPAGVIRPLGLPATYGGNVHGAVKVPGKPYLVLVEEAYANAGKGCPFGWLRMADVKDETAVKIVPGEFKIQENDCDKAKALNGTFTAHNQTVFPNVALVPWYGGGLRAVDISNPAAPSEAGAFVPKPTFEPARRDNRLFFPGSEFNQWVGAMWSYPVVQNGLVYVVDIDLGLYVLRYTGKHANEVARAAYVEGNSAPSRYSAKDPVIHRPAAAWPAVTAPRVVRSPWSAAARVPARPMSAYGFFCTGG